MRPTDATYPRDLEAELDAEEQVRAEMETDTGSYLADLELDEAYEEYLRFKLAPKGGK